MSARAHLRLLVVAPLVWLAFWIAGLPHYYQQYPFALVAVACALLVPPTAWVGWRSITRARPEHRLSRSLWLSFYFTVPFAFLDWLYCGVYLGHGADFPARYWYLTIYYFIPWILWVPIAYLPTSFGSRVSE